MKRLLLLLPLLLTLPVAGCVTAGQIGDLVTAATTTVDNPVGAVDLYRAKNTYAASLELVVRYRDECWKRPYAVLMADPIYAPVCKDRRAVVRQAQNLRHTAGAAIKAADNFIRDNPTLNAASAIAAAIKAVTDFKSAVPTVR
jgi:ElaB/YqjD/DUF883 family membrane-anchored ribosome-binding protein